MIGQSLKMAWKAISSNKTRSFLTMLGIIIGVMALVVLVSLVNGATSSVTDQISSLGSNKLTVRISDDKGNPLKLDDLSTFTKISSIKEIAPTATASVTATSDYTKNNSDSDDDSESVNLTGTTSSYKDIDGLSIGWGRFFNVTDVNNHTNVIVINADTAQDIMGTYNCVGQSIKLNGTSYTIVGVLEAEDDSSSSSSTSYSDYEAYIPYTSLVRLSSSVSTDISSFVVSSTSDDSLDSAETALTNSLLSRFENDDTAFTVQNESDIMSAMESVTSTLSLLLGGIAGISLLVGGIGIMNIMLVSVTERTREIGIRKAIGAGRNVIMMQFLIEALMVSLIGCAIGIAGSWIIVRIVSIVAVAKGYDLTFSLSIGVVWIAILFSTAIGIIFGLYPANKAAKKNPIEALRYMG